MGRIEPFSEVGDRLLEGQPVARYVYDAIETASLERRVQEANLTVKGARAAKGVILEKQWLRSPLAGLVSDVRVKSVTGKGFRWRS